MRVNCGKVSAKLDACISSWWYLRHTQCTASWLMLKCDATNSSDCIPMHPFLLTFSYVSANCSSSLFPTGAFGRCCIDRHRISMQDLDLD